MIDTLTILGGLTVLHIGIFVILKALFERLEGRL